jgi:small neutral amino acid transporter SnatA (MarC family)
MVVPLKLHLQAFVTVLSLVNPVMCGLIFAGTESSRSPRQRLADATKVGMAMLVILGLAALFGARVLNLFGISLDAFSVAGGGVLVWMGVSMLRGANAESADNSSLTTLILFAASPGTVTGVITLAVAHSRSELPVTALTAVAAASLVTYLVMVVVAKRGSQAGGGGFVRSTVQSFMGLLVMAMGVQFGLKGLSTFIERSGG